MGLLNVGKKCQTFGEGGIFQSGECWMQAPLAPGISGAQSCAAEPVCQDQHHGFDSAVLGSFFLSKTMFKSQLFPHFLPLFFLMIKDKHLKTKMYTRCLKTEIISSKCFNHAVENHFPQRPNHINYSKRLKTKFNCIKLPTMISQKWICFY